MIIKSPNVGLHNCDLCSPKVKDARSNRALATIFSPEIKYFHGWIPSPF